MGAASGHAEPRDDGRPQLPDFHEMAAASAASAAEPMEDERDLAQLLQVRLLAYPSCLFLKLRHAVFSCFHTTTAWAMQAHNFFSR